MKINITQKFNTILGILEFERINKQRIIVDTVIDYRYQKDIFINYADIVSIIEFNMKVKKFLLIEEALEYLISLFINKYPSIIYCEIKIIKPDIIDGASVSVSNKYIRS